MSGEETSRSSSPTAGDALSHGASPSVAPAAATGSAAAGAPPSMTVSLEKLDGRWHVELALPPFNGAVRRLYLASDVAAALGNDLVKYAALAAAE